ncbi:hypothetical protein T190_01670 [Sinorhizobium meliloti CCBAU 01290]|nr:hypothetical protein T190_01670 [Sinorhizobium meliloti CCBAU 01290]
MKIAYHRWRGVLASKEKAALPLKAWGDSENACEARFSRGRHRSGR